MAEEGNENEHHMYQVFDGVMDLFIAYYYYYLSQAMQRDRNWCLCGMQVNSELK